MQDRDGIDHGFGVEGGRARGHLVPERRERRRGVFDRRRAVGAVVQSNGPSVVQRMRNGAGSRSIAASHGSAGGGAKYGSPAAGPAVASNSAAQSRTVRVSACSLTSPSSPCPPSGAIVLRPRAGLRPITPQHAAGTRIEPVPSPPEAAGTSPAATATADPPLEPPGERPARAG